MIVQDKTIVVTGGGNGVGRELTLELLSKGAKVLAADINKDALNETVRISGNNKNLFIYVVDISNKETVLSFTKKVISEHGNIDGIINNAGIIQPFVHIKDLGLENIERVMNINYYGTLYMTKAFLPHLLQRPEAHIVNVSSLGGFLPVPGQGAYGASKAAVKLLTEALYSELIDTNVKVTVIIPGGINTNIKKNSNIETNDSQEDKSSKLLLTPNQAAKLIIDSMEKEKLRAYIGKDSKLMKALYKMSPSSATKLINRAMGSKEH